MTSFGTEGNGVKNLRGNIQDPSLRSGGQAGNQVDSSLRSEGQMKIKKVPQTWGFCNIQ